MESKHLAVLLAILGLVSVMFMNQKVSGPTEFETWKLKFGVKHDSLFEEAYREKIFLENLAQINSHNSNKARTYDMGVNQFTGMTQEEFEQNYLGLVIPQGEIVNDAISNEDYTAADIDWRAKGAVTGVKNQGSCGSCWAFSATGGLEGLSKLAYGDLRSFSEQQLVDCSAKYGNQACNGGLMDSAFKFVKDNGIVLESEYPYKAVKQACAKTTGSFKISGFTDIKNCNDLAKALESRPISVAVDASSWSKYQGGVITTCTTKLNHGVLLVGISNNNWVVKNSWGTGWGETGFVRLATGNTCGICTAASFPNK